MIRWASFIANKDGEIDYDRVRSLVSVGLGILGGLLSIAVVFLVREVKEQLVYMVVASLVLPITGGKIAEVIGAFGAKGQAKTAAKIQAGDAPDRRAGSGSTFPLPAPSADRGGAS